MIFMMGQRQVLRTKVVSVSMAGAMSLPCKAATFYAWDYPSRPSDPCGWAGRKVAASLTSSTTLLSPGEVVKHGVIKCILNEGMPHYKNPFEKGRLIVQFLVKFPERIDPGHAAQLEKLLPARWGSGHCCSVFSLMQ